MIEMKRKIRSVSFTAVMTACVIALLVTGIATGQGTDATVDSGLIDQNEISLTLIPGTVPGQPQVLLAAYNDGALSGSTGLGVSYSTNGGATWIPQQLPYPTHSLGYTMVEAWDPATAADTQGNLFVAHISTDGNWGAGPATGLYVRKSTNSGVSWQTPVPVSENGPAQKSPDPNYRLNDRDQMAVDTFAGSPNTDNIYISWIKDRGWNISQPYGDIYFAYSSNGGASFSMATGTSAAFPGRINDEGAGHDMGNMPVPAVAPDGTVYVSWMDYNVQTGGTGTIYLDKSTDGGASWGTDVTVTTVNLPPLNLNPGMDNTRAKGAPVLKVSPNNSSELYLVYAEDPDRIFLPDGTTVDGPDDASINFIKSANGGNTWTAPIRVNDDITQNDQILPWMDVKPNGSIDIAWYDRRNDPADRNWDIFVTRSTNNGVSFANNLSINDTSFASPVISGEGRIGEYLGLAVDSSYMYVAWTSSVTDISGDIYFDKQDNSGICTSGRPSLSISSVRPYWASYSDYTARHLSVDYTIANTGADGAYSVQLTGSTATNGVTLVTTVPAGAGNIAAGASIPVTLVYQVPGGVSAFRTTNSAGAQDQCGATFVYGPTQP